MKTFALLGWALVVGALAGVLLDVATFLMARYGPQADGWSFRGNGALVVPFLLGPALLASGWTALVARYRGFARWLIRGLAAGLIGCVFFLVSVFALVLFNSAGMGISNAMLVAVLGWMVVAPVIAAFIPTHWPRPQPSQLLSHLGAGAAGPVATVVAFFIAGLVLPPGS